MIEVKNLVKQYGKNKAVDNISFTVNKGEILGFLGSNGAGKTTTMNMLTGYLGPTSGDILINGVDILLEPETVKKSIGYLSDNPPLYRDLTVKEHLSFVYDLKKLPKDKKADELDRVMHKVEVTDMKDRLCKNLSKGYRQRVGLATALVGEPEILVLDEPSSGLDPKQIIEMRNMVKGLSKTHTVILSSHILSEVSNICDRVMIINNGKIIAADTPENLGKMLNEGAKTHIRVKDNNDIEKLINLLNESEEVVDIEKLETEEAGTADLLIKGQGNLDIRNVISKIIFESGFELLMLKPQDVNLETIFLEITNNEELETKEIEIIDTNINEKEGL